MPATLPTDFAGSLCCGAHLPIVLFPQAEARQNQWAGTAAGKATLKSVKAVKEERAAGRPVTNDNTRDWLS